MVKLFNLRYPGNGDALRIISHKFYSSIALHHAWPQMAHDSDYELPLGLNNSVLLYKDGSVAYNTNREWPDMPPEIAAQLGASAQLDRGCLDILSAAGISVPEPIVDPKPSPTAVQKIFNLADAMVSWAASGFKIAPEDSYKARKAICLACDQWNGEGYFGAGACKQCGCSGAKLYLASSTCPLKKW